jgi:hypothetical protein
MPPLTPTINTRKGLVCQVSRENLSSKWWRLWCLSVGKSYIQTTHGRGFHSMYLLISRMAFAKIIVISLVVHLFSLVFARVFVEVDG